VLRVRPVTTQLTLDEWHASGTHVELCGHRIFTRVEGPSDAPCVTLLHGFPTSSWDYARVARLLVPRRRLVALDFLGYGHSAKPRDVAFALATQADLVEALWKHLGITDTAILAHDLGDAVTEELLARDPSSRATTIRRAMFMNGAMIAHLNRVLFIQTLLRTPGIGAIVTRLTTERLFRNSFRKVFSSAHPISDDDVHEHWRAITESRGNTLYHRLVYHYGDHERNAERLESILWTTRVPLKLVWGMTDPVSGPDMVAYMRERGPAIDIVELPEISHYPHLEVPDRVADEFLRFDT
jgi:pimeloyl-ACP methyl ester carboxylesterase